MKKLILAFTLFMFALAGHVSAQTAPMAEYQITVRMSDGTNVVTLPDGRGTITLQKSGNMFSGVMYTDAAGAVTRLAPNSGGTGGAPRPVCKYPLPDACFGMPSQNIGMCICGPKDITSGTREYNIGLLLPAVQQIRL